MSTVKVINVVHPSSATNNIVLDSSGNASVGGTMAMGSSFMRNRIINGNFDIWQRGTTGTGAVYVSDRWGTDQVNTTQAQSSSVPNVESTYSIQVSGSSGTIATSQKIESFNCYDLSGQKVTLSFYAKSATGTPTLNFDLRYANALNNFSSMTIMQGSSTTISTTWTKYTFTFNALNANVANGLALFFYNTSTQTFFLSQVQLEAGSVATQFEREIYSTTLAKCQRYYQIWSPPPGRGVSNSTTAINRIGWPLLVEMRIAPTLVISGNIGWYDGTATGTISSATAGYATTKMAEFDATASGVTAAGRPIVLYVGGSTGTISVNAEL